MSPFTWAAGLGNLKLVKLLLSRGAEINDVDTQGYTAVHRAVSEGHSNVVRFLLEHGADPNIKDNIDNYTCLDHAIKWTKSDPIIRILEAKYSFRATKENENLRN